MNFEHLAHTIHAGLADDLCALCGVPIATWLDEIACPHWFLAHGRVGLRPEKLAAVFECYEPPVVIDYLLLVAEHGRAASGRPSWHEWDDDDGWHVRIAWRLRTWQFSFVTAPRAPEHVVRGFLLSTFYRDARVALGRIDLLDGAQRVRFTPLVQHGRAVAATKS